MRLDFEKVYKYLKSQSENDGKLLLFRTHLGLEAYFEDAAKISAALILPVINERVIAPDSFETVGKLGELFEIKVIGWRDENGELSLPDIDQIKRDKEADY